MSQGVDEASDPLSAPILLIGQSAGGFGAAGPAVSSAPTEGVAVVPLSGTTRSPTPSTRRSPARSTSATTYPRPALTEVKEFEGPHLLPAARGWAEVADYALDWAAEHSVRTTTAA